MSAGSRAVRHSIVGLLLLAIPDLAGAQDRRDDQFYYPGRFNWSFLETYPEAARLFNAFDYGHAVLYEVLLTRPGSAAEALEKEFRFLTTDLLVRPPRFAVAEEVIEPTYAKLVWQAKQMFDWAHVLHRQIYDVYADERLGDAERDVLIERLTDYYLSRKDYAFAAVPKSMALMDEQYFSQVFRKRHPKFNGLIWAYHWLQVGLYEPLIQGKTPAEKKSGLKATLARFWSMLENPPAGFPRMMPMTSAIAPSFSAKHPRAAVIFDNLHMMHDVISDILAADTIPRDRKRAAIYEQLAEFRDGSRNTMTMEEWRNMAEAMGGVGAMGGPATQLLVPAADSGMAGMHHGAKPAKPAADTAMPGMRHAPPPRDTAARAPMADSDEHPHGSRQPMTAGSLFRLAAFTTTPTGGNPAGVWVGDALPDPATMQRIATEVGFSETAFVAPRGGADRTARYYSPLAEVPFCGHATIAAGVVLGETSGDGTYRLSTLAGDIPVTVRTRGPHREASLTSVEPTSLAAPESLVTAALATLGWRRTDLDPAIPPAKAYAGVWHLVIAVATAGRLAGLAYDFDGLKALMLRENLTTLQLVWRESPEVFHSRNPFPVGGVVEDSATGAAAAALGGYLRAAGLVTVPAHITIRQGETMGRPSLLAVDIPRAGGIVVSGTAVHL